MEMGENEEIKEYIRQAEKGGKVVFGTIEGLVEANLDEFIKQPAEGILYDLNRDKATVMTFIDDPKWLNDYAVAVTVTALRARIEELTIPDEVLDTAIYSIEIAIEEAPVVDKPPYRKAHKWLTAYKEAQG
jgi:hypothetical protein